MDDQAGWSRIDQRSWIDVCEGVEPVGGTTLRERILTELPFIAAKVAHHSAASTETTNSKRVKVPYPTSSLSLRA